MVLQQIAIFLRMSSNKSRSDSGTSSYFYPMTLCKMSLVMSSDKIQASNELKNIRQLLS